MTPKATTVRVRLRVAPWFALWSQAYLARAELGGPFDEDFVRMMLYVAIEVSP